MNGGKMNSFFLGHEGDFFQQNNKIQMFGNIQQSVNFYRVKLQTGWLEQYSFQLECKAITSYWVVLSL